MNLLSFKAFYQEFQTDDQETKKLYHSRGGCISSSKKKSQRLFS